MITHEKPRSFFDTFERKQPLPGPGQKTTHYCPGCGHGTAHKLIAEAIDDLAIQDRTVFLSPVGCAAFAYYYFDTGNVACSHGRAPAVGTAVARTLDHAVVISYQGDGDLAGIGTAEIVHAANRNEHMAVFFINNAIYGMTGGQMAPTTPLGRITATTPLGRDLLREGGPIHMSEMLNQLDGPVYIERVSLGDVRRVLTARKAIRKALRNQVDRRGFSFVEILSPCPVNWKMTPGQARSWIIDVLEKVFPPGVYRDRDTEPSSSARLPAMDESQLLRLLEVDPSDTAPPLSSVQQDHRVRIAGFGGQGVMSAGILLANCAIAEGSNATWLPSYGPEMRGGTANASVVISADPIGSPLVDRPTALIAMNAPSLDEFEASVAPGGLMVINSSLVDRQSTRTDVRTVYVPATEVAREAGFIRGANILLLAVCARMIGAVTEATLRNIIPKSLKKQEFVEANLKMVDEAARFGDA